MKQPVQFLFPEPEYGNRTTDAHLSHFHVALGYFPLALGYFPFWPSPQSNRGGLGTKQQHKRSQFAPTRGANEISWTTACRYVWIAVEIRIADAGV